MIRAFIVEDEQPAIARLKELLKEVPDVEIVGIYSSGAEAVPRIDELKPELIFLDVHLTDMLGVDMLRLVTHQPAVIFTTAYDQYAVEAFELGAVDYLLKPFSAERLEQALQRVRERRSVGADATRQLETLFSHWRMPHAFLQRIPARAGNKIIILRDEDIVYFASENKLVFAHLFEKKRLINYTLEELQQRLNPDNFFRIHRSTIVNLNYVKSIEPWFAGGYRMTVRDKQGSELNISRNAAKELRKKLGW